MKTLKEAQETMIRELKELEDGSSQCGYLLEKGFGAGDKEDIRREENKIPGCQTAIWQTAGWEGGRLKLEADSDSILVKGVLELMRELYGGRKAEEIRRNPPAFLEEIREEVLCREIRENGLRRFYSRLLGERPGRRDCF